VLKELRAFRDLLAIPDLKDYKALKV